MRLLLVLMLGLAGAAGGVAGGLALRPDAAAPVEDGTAHPVADPAPAPAPPTDAEGMEYVKLNNQFVVPVVAGREVRSLVVMSLSLEIARGERETVYAREPKLRDALLQAMFDHANMGGFDGAFTDGNTLDILRTALAETARDVLGGSVRGVLIVDIARQDM